jgi:hypothetical protein
MLLTYGAHHMQPMPKALQQMHRKLSQVVRDLTRVTGMALRHALIAGARAPLPLARLRHPHCQHREEEIAKALQGPWRAEHRFAFQQAVAWSPFSHQPLTVCAHHIHAHLGTFADKSDGPPLPPKPRRHKKVHEPRFAARPPLDRLAGVDLTTMEGIEEGTALVILSEIGTTMSRWPRVTPVCSWRGLAPQHQISGGKGLSTICQPPFVKFYPLRTTGSQRIRLAS